MQVTIITKNYTAYTTTEIIHNVSLNNVVVHHSFKSMEKKDFQVFKQKNCKNYKNLENQYTKKKRKEKKNPFKITHVLKNHRVHVTIKQIVNDYKRDVALVFR